MKMFRTLRAFLTDETGAAAAEFALVSVLFLSLMMGTIDMARLVWELNSAKAATRAGARLAVVSPIADPDALDAYQEVIADNGIGAGESIPANLLPTITCTAATCDGGSFINIVARMQGFYGRLQPENIVIEYRPVGLGFAGNPYGPPVEPLVTVRLCNSAVDADGSCSPVQFAPGILQAFGIAPFDMPAVASSLTGEFMCETPDGSLYCGGAST